MHAAGITGAEAVRARTEVMDSYRRLPILAPQVRAHTVADLLRGVSPARDAEESPTIT
jgi:hypothetical protein